MSLLLASQYPANRLSTSVDNEMLSQRLRSSGHAVLRTVSPGTWAVEGSSIFGSIALPHLRRKASNSWSAVQESYVSTKQVFESHRVVCTFGTSIASILTAWAATVWVGGWSMVYQ
ncbi:uncharacterized protein LOC113460950 [Phoenix dactylifera]|uniref:Uncharacterized protein LOC113460950 n=1 Tax=Phoenix dactylifera TaxID=42345 RepID=A0A8B9APZ4_PHODC|nr:uncharacterized protein LOC113460950 [Phoenix dactylifera]